jgi:hypothetical protein
MAEETIELTKKALHRLKVVEAVGEKRLTQGEAARQLGVTQRQVRRLVADYRREGAAGLVSRRRGKPSNRRLKPRCATASEPCWWSGIRTLARRWRGRSCWRCLR